MPSTDTFNANHYAVPVEDTTNNENSVLANTYAVPVVRNTDNENGIQAQNSEFAPEVPPPEDSAPPAYSLI